MPIVPQSEIQVKFLEELFKETDEKCGEILVQDSPPTHAKPVKLSVATQGPNWKGLQGIRAKGNSLKIHW